MYQLPHSRFSVKKKQYVAYFYFIKKYKIKQKQIIE